MLQKKQKFRIEVNLCHILGPPLSVNLCRVYTWELGGANTVNPVSLAEKKINGFLVL